MPDTAPTDVRPDVRPDHGGPGGDPEGRTHIVRDTDGNADRVVRNAIATGDTVVALCGYRWTPKLMPQPDDLPVCQPCLKAAEARYG